MTERDEADANRERATTAGQRAERLVFDRLRAALPPDTVVLSNVRWLNRDHGHVRQGEADIVIGDADRGILVLEVKAGEIRRDGNGSWWAGHKVLPRAPFEQAADSRHTLIRKLGELPAWPGGLKPIAGHAVAFPDVELDTMRGRLGLLGFEFDSGLVADQSTFVATSQGEADLRLFLDHAFEAWSGGAETRAPGRAAIDLLIATMTDPVELKPMLRNEITGGEQAVVRLTRGQIALLDTLRYQRRAAVVGGAGTGKTMLAAEKARRLAADGFSTLLVCFNAPLARMLSDELSSVVREGEHLDVKTFHQLCEDLGREAGVLPSRPNPVPQDWWDTTLPDALDEAIAKTGPRYHAIVVDEGQDFDAEWLASLDELLIGGKEDVLYVFHDPAQAIYREDVVAQLGLPAYPLTTNCRNAQPIHAVVSRFAEGGLDAEALRTDGRAPEFVEATTDAEVREALRKVLHRLRVEEEVKPWDIAVLTGRRLETSAVWAAPGRRYGNEVLGNPSLDDAGHHLGAAANAVPALPDDVVLCDTIRRFKGLERPVIVLVELSADDQRLDRMLYVGASRARQHLVVIGSPAVLGRLGRTGSVEASESQNEHEGRIDAIDGVRAQAAGPGSEHDRREGHELVAFHESVPGQARLTSGDRHEVAWVLRRGSRGAGHRDDDDRVGALHPVRPNDDRRMRSPDDMAADVRKVDDMDIAAGRTGVGRDASDPYHSMSDMSLAAIGRYARAQARFSSASSSNARSRRSCSDTSSVCRRDAPIVALTVSPVAAAASRIRSTRSVGRLMDSFTWGVVDGSGPYEAMASANACCWNVRVSLMVGRMVG